MIWIQKEHSKAQLWRRNHQNIVERTDRSLPAISKMFSSMQERLYRERWDKI